MEIQRYGIPIQSTSAVTPITPVHRPGNNPKQRYRLPTRRILNKKNGRLHPLSDPPYNTLDVIA